MNKFEHLKNQISQCRICEDSLEFGVNPIVQIHPKAKILIAGQAPGKKVHESSIPFNDASGDKLRDWLGVNKQQFYNPELFAILPMGFCYPGKGKSGDLPPRKECAEHWRIATLQQLTNIKLTLLIGQYAIKWHLGDGAKKNLTETVKNWQHYSGNQVPLPHPSPRNFIWFKNNPWFEQELVPYLKTQVRKLSG